MSAKFCDYHKNVLFFRECILIEKRKSLYLFENKKNLELHRYNLY